MATFRIKPHHFIDILRDIGAGRDFTPHPLGHAFHLVAQRALADREVILEFTVGADDICQPCVHNVDGRCDDRLKTWHPQMPDAKEAFNCQLDARWMNRLGLCEGQRMKATDCCQLIEDRAGKLADLYAYDDEPWVQARAEQLRQGIASFLQRAAADARVQQPLPADTAGTRTASDQSLKGSVPSVGRE